MEVHRELFTPTQVLIHEEVRATIFALMVEQPQVFQISTTEVDIKPAVRRYMIEHRTEFQGRPGQRGSHGQAAEAIEVLPDRLGIQVTQ